MYLNLSWREFSPADGVIVEIRPLKIWAFQELAQVAGQKAMEDGKVKMEGGAVWELLAAARKVFPEHVRNVKGLTIEDGESRPATVEDLSDETALAMSIGASIVAELLSISSPQGPEPGNSAGASPSSSKTGEPTNKSASAA